MFSESLSPLKKRLGAPVHPMKELGAFMGESCRYEGKLLYDGFVRIDGLFSGEIFTHNILIVGRKGELKANVVAGEVVIHGTFIGEIEATRVVEIKAGSSVRGVVSTPLLIIEEGATFDGEIRG